MRELLCEKRFDIISNKDKEFIIKFNKEMNKLGYGHKNVIGPGYCWGKYMIIYSKLGIKSKKIVSRIYIRKESIVLRLYLNKINRHKEYIENSEDFIQKAFISEYGDCGKCHNNHDGECKFRKSYSLHDTLYNKCNGTTFEFGNPTTEKLSGYIGLLREFYPGTSK
ncbi:hypothetical protein KHQ81_14430 [Mycoplasmatota bacterium]|nr:hypothetical protein KHQ81_14430 [Mycoplasmatota bacterium]